MTTHVLRQADTVLGLPLAWLAGLLFRRRSSRPQAPRHVVVVKLFGLGSIILAAQALRQFKRAQPQAHITLITFAQHAEIGTLLTVFDETLAIETRTPLNLLRSIWSVLCRLRRARPDLVIDLEYFSKLTTVFCSLLGARYRLGFLLPVRWRSRLLDDGIAFREDIHFAESVGRLLHAWGVPYWNITCAPCDGMFRIMPAAEDLPGRPLTNYIVINPNAHDMCIERRWPLQKFADLITRFLTINVVDHLVIVGASHERPMCEYLRTLVPEPVRARVVVSAGQTTLRQLALLLQRARLLVSNDSGVMHLAAALGVPLVALFGPESPVRYAPLAPTARCVVLAARVPCGPCLSFMNKKTAPCAGQNICMQNIAVADVFRVSLEMLRTLDALPRSDVSQSRPYESLLLQSALSDVQQPTRVSSTDTIVPASQALFGPSTS